ncbi:MAG: hypothetical protein WBA46_16230 [Thermomicrobiales bacterium]
MHPLPHTRLTRRAMLATAGAAMLPLTGIAASARATPSPAAMRREKPAPSLEILTDILQVLPGTLAEMEQPGVLFTFVDLEAQRNALDLPPFDPEAAEQSVDQWNAISMLPLWMTPFLYARDEEFIALLGFHPLTTLQAMEINTGPRRVTLLRGDFAMETLATAWEAAGYTRMETSTGAPAWSSGPDGHFSPDDPLQRRATGSLNNVMQLDGEWLVFTRFFDQLDAIATFAAATTADSLFAAPGVGETIAMLHDETVATIAIPGSMLTPEETIQDGSTAQDAITAADAETGPLPAADLLMMAVNGGLVPVEGGNRSVLDEIVVQACLAFPDQQMASAAATTIVHRWETLNSQVTGAPYTDYMTVTESGAVSGVASLDFTIGGSPAYFQMMVRERDWLPFVATA